MYCYKLIKNKNDEKIIDVLPDGHESVGTIILNKNDNSWTYCINMELKDEECFKEHLVHTYMYLIGLIRDITGIKDPITQTKLPKPSKIENN